MSVPTCTPSHNTSFHLTDPTPTDTYTLSLHDALPICSGKRRRNTALESLICCSKVATPKTGTPGSRGLDRKSTRLNSSHRCISYAVFCLKKKKEHRFLAS